MDFSHFLYNINFIFAPLPITFFFYPKPYTKIFCICEISQDNIQLRYKQFKMGACRNIQ